MYYLKEFLDMAIIMIYDVWINPLKFAIFLNNLERTTLRFSFYGKSFQGQRKHKKPISCASVEIVSCIFPSIYIFIEKLCFIMLSDVSSN
jgi:hypothetical protein